MTDTTPSFKGQRLYDRGLKAGQQQAKSALVAPGAPVLPPPVGHIFRLAEIIRAVDGNHDKGAAALAEAILSHPDFGKSAWGYAQSIPGRKELADIINGLMRIVESRWEYDWRGDVTNAPSADLAIATRAIAAVKRLTTQTQENTNE